jgi:hypothetical protein
VGARIALASIMLALAVLHAQFPSVLYAKRENDSGG